MRRAALAAALLLSLALLYYFLRFSLATFSAHDLRQFATAEVVGAILAAALIGLVVALISAKAWGLLLAGMDKPWPIRALVAILTSTQIAKYVPGNIAQHVGRAAFAVSLGMSPGVFAVSVFFETILLLAMGMTTGMGLMLLAGGADFAAVQWKPLLLAAGALSAVGILTALVMPRLQVLLTDSALGRRFRGVGVKPPKWLHVAGACVAYCTCYLMLGAGLLLVARALGAGPGLGYCGLTSAFAIAWLTGFLAPGLPAGFGAREGAMLMLLNGRASDDVLFSLIVASRLATVLGDLACLALGLVVSRGIRESFRQ